MLARLPFEPPIRGWDIKCGMLTELGFLLVGSLRMRIDRHHVEQGRANRSLPCSGRTILGFTDNHHSENGIQHHLGVPVQSPQWRCICTVFFCYLLLLLMSLRFPKQRITTPLVCNFISITCDNEVLSICLDFILFRVLTSLCFWYDSVVSVSYHTRNEFILKWFDSICERYEIYRRCLE